jgi:hypothetical protein
MPVTSSSPSDSGLDFYQVAKLARNLEVEQKLIEESSGWST